MNLLERTRRLLKGLSPPPPAKVQYYSVSCVEGHRLRGERTEGYQALRCPTCGEGIFVLPRSPLPEPAAASSAREAPRVEVAVEREEEPIELSDPLPYQASEASEFDGEIDWLEPPPENEATATAAREEVPAAPPVRKAAAETTRRDAPKRPGAAASASRPEPRTIAVEDRESFGDWARRRRNPLIAVAVVLVVAGTVGFRVWRSRFQDLPRIAELGREQGLPALDAGEFDTAHQLLSEAKRAVDSLGDAFEGAAEIRHGADEAAIFTSLSPEPLESILAEASSDTKEWSARFNTFYRGRSILVIDAQVTGVPDASGSGSFDLDYRIFPNGENAQPPKLRIGRIDLTGFRLIELAAPKLGDKVRFAARLESLTLVNKEWRVGLIPDSGVFLTHPKALEALGLPGELDEGGEEQP